MSCKILVSICSVAGYGLVQEIGTLFLNVPHSLVLNLSFDGTKLALILVKICLEFIQVDRSFRLLD